MKVALAVSELPDAMRFTDCEGGETSIDINPGIEGGTMLPPVPPPGPPIGLTPAHPTLSAQEAMTAESNVR
jgi:hypothetical protein